MERKNTEGTTSAPLSALQAAVVCDDEQRLDHLIDGARQSGFTIDFLADLTDGLSAEAARTVIGNASVIAARRKAASYPLFRVQGLEAAR